MLPATPPKLGRYEIVDEIGKGAMGVVYLARDPLIGRLVALKTFRIGYSVRDSELEQFRIRFMREAQSAGILSHPNIVTIHDVVEQTEEGLAFIAMEYVRGTTLKALLQSDQPMSLQFIVDVVSQVAEALDYAHAHRVIHRDVKPANILITADNKVKITDFGIARLDTSNLTQEGQLLGTPNYMAPEQIQGKEIDHRADLFALGVVLYEMLTRHKPFQGENLTVVSHRIVYDHFTPPKEYARDLPPGVEQVLDRALEKDPSRRYQRARDLAEDLRRVLSASRDDLNETLSIASWAPGMEPARYNTPPGGVVTTVSGGSAGTPPPAPAPMAAKPAPAPKKPRQPMSTRRILMFAGVAAVIAILAAAAILLAISWSGGKEAGEPPATPVQDATQARYLALVRQGEGLRNQFKFAEAINAFTHAMQLAPQGEKAKMVSEIQRTQELAADYFQTLDRTGKIAAHLADAKIALEDGRFDSALESADALLVLEPAHEEGLKIRADAQKGKEALRNKQRKTAPGQQPTPREQIATATPAPSPVSTPLQETAAPVAQGALIKVAYSSEGPGATVILRLKGDEVFRKTFARGGFLRRGRFDASEDFKMSPGTVDFDIQVTAGNKPAQTFRQSAILRGGHTHTLNIRVAKSGVATVSLAD